MHCSTASKSYPFDPSTKLTIKEPTAKNFQGDVQPSTSKLKYTT